MDIIPDTLTKLRSLSNFDYYYLQNQEKVNIEYNNLGSVNTFSSITLNNNTTVPKYTENGFPNDVPAKYMDGFSVVVVHEVNHRIEPDYLTQNKSLNDRRLQIIKQAGNVKLQYLRSMFADDFFQKYPQEFISSIANQWFCSSELTMKLGLTRFDKGYKEPINQVLYFCELYSLGKEFTKFYSIDLNSNIIFQNINLKRDINGHINQLQISNLTYNFKLDSLGNVLSYSISTEIVPVAKKPIIPIVPITTQTKSTITIDRVTVKQYGDNTNNILNINPNTTIFTTINGIWNKYVQLPIGYNGYKLKLICNSTFGFTILKNRTNLKSNLYVSPGSEINFQFKSNL
jgi:hypothetical protein